MKTLNNPENLKSHGQHDLGQIIADQEPCKTCNGEGGFEAAASSTSYFWKECLDCKTPPIKDKSREEIEAIIESLEGANMSTTIKALNGIERGSYRISITRDSEYNEVQVRLKDGPSGRHPIASGYIDQGHTRESRFEAAAEVRGLVRAYLCR